MTVWLVDKSALTRFPSSPDAQEWARRMDRGLVHIAMPTLLELGYSARSSADWTSVLALDPIDALPVEHATPAGERRALEVQGLLAQRGRHRAPSIPDLLVAACAEIAGLTVLHLDKDFELVAEVTGQSTERLRLSA